MRRSLVALLLFLLGTGANASAEVHSVAGVSFDVPPGWTYKAARDGGAMALKDGGTVWLMAVYSPMTSSGDKQADWQAAWKRIALAGADYRGVPAPSYYDITQSIGYSGVYYGAGSVAGDTYTLLYVLEAGKSFIPVITVSGNQALLSQKYSVLYEMLGTLRLAPAKAAPIKYRITRADLTGNWTSGAATGTTYVNSVTGLYAATSVTAIKGDYKIASDGSYHYAAGGLLNNSMANAADTGTVQLAGEFVTFAGQKFHERYRFHCMQHALDGSDVLTLLPDADPSRIDILRDATLWVRKH